MSDKGFDFRPPGRREPKRFEPPPWEADAFQELQEKRSDQQSDEEIAQAIVALETDESTVRPVEPAVPQPAVEPAATQAKKAGGVDENVMLEMMAGLAAEEPPAHQGYWKVAIASALLIGALGLVLVVWGTAALVGSRTTGPVGSFGGTVLLLFGAGFVAAALWLAMRTLRQRGVL